DRFRALDESKGGGPELGPLRAELGLLPLQVGLAGEQTRALPLERSLLTFQLGLLRLQSVGLVLQLPLLAVELVLERDRLGMLLRVRGARFRDRVECPRD